MFMFSCFLAGPVLKGYRPFNQAKPCTLAPILKKKSKHLQNHEMTKHIYKRENNICNSPYVCLLSLSLYIYIYIYPEKERLERILRNSERTALGRRYTVELQWLIIQYI